MSETSNVGQQEPHTAVGEKIKRLRSFRGMTCAELAEAVGCTRPYLSAVENGRYPASTKILRKLQKVLAVEGNYFTSPGEPELSETSSYTRESLQGASPSDVSRTGGTSRRIPFVTLSSKGEPSVDFDEYPTKNTDMIDCPPGVADDDAFALRYDSDAMSPLIPQGSMMIVAPNMRIRDRHPVIVKTTNGDMVCGNYHAREQMVILAPLNHAREVQVFEATSIDWIYPVVKVVVDMYSDYSPMR